MPKWNTLKPDEIRAIIVDLRQWVINEYQQFDDKYNPTLTPDTSSPVSPELAKWKAEAESNPSFMEAFSYLRQTPFPIEIYERAGYTTGYCQKQRRNTNARHNN